MNIALAIVGLALISCQVECALHRKEDLQKKGAAIEGLHSQNRHWGLQKKTMPPNPQDYGVNWELQDKKAEHQNSVLAHRCSWLTQNADIIKDLTEEDVWQNDLTKESVKCMSLRADIELFALIAFDKDKDPESSDFLKKNKCLLDDCPKDFDENPDEV